MEKKTLKRNDLVNLGLKYNQFFGTKHSLAGFESLYSNYSYYRWLVEELEYEKERAIYLASTMMANPLRKEFTRFISFLECYLFSYIR